MRRKRSVAAAIVGMMAVMAMLVGVVMPNVYASSAGSAYQGDKVTVGTTVVCKDDTLLFPSSDWGVGTQGVLIQYLDENRRILKEDRVYQDYTIPAYSDLGLSGSIFDSDAKWLVTAAPTSPQQLVWELELCTGGSVSSGDAGKPSIQSSGDYKLRAGVTYTLENGVRRVQGDATVYASPIEFTVDADGKYNFFY